MFGSAPELMAVTECRPDAELMLREARKQKEKIEAALSSLREIANSERCGTGLLNGDDAFRFVGTLTVALWEADKRIERLFKEVDGSRWR